MAQEKPNRLTEWYLALREHAPTLRQGFGDWLEAVRAEPVLLWQTPAVLLDTTSRDLLLGSITSDTAHSYSI